MVGAINQTTISSSRYLWHIRDQACTHITKIARYICIPLDNPTSRLDITITMSDLTRRSRRDPRIWRERDQFNI